MELFWQWIDFHMLITLHTVRYKYPLVTGIWHIDNESFPTYNEIQLLMPQMIYIRGMSFVMRSPCQPTLTQPQQIKVWTTWLAFCRRHFKLFSMTIFVSGLNFSLLCSRLSVNQHLLSYGLMPYRQQNNSVTNVCWPRYQASYDVTRPLWVTYIKPKPRIKSKCRKQTNKQKTRREIHKYLIWKNFVVIIKF